MNGFNGRKTGLFKPVWLADRFPEVLVMGWGNRKRSVFKIRIPGWFAIIIERDRGNYVIRQIGEGLRDTF
jgi:hypothetical protein